MCYLKQKTSAFDFIRFLPRKEFTLNSIEKNGGNMQSSAPEHVFLFYKRKSHIQNEATLNYFFNLEEV